MLPRGSGFSSAPTSKPTLDSGGWVRKQAIKGRAACRQPGAALQSFSITAVDANTQSDGVNSEISSTKSDAGVNTLDLTITVKEMAEETDSSQAPPLARCFYPREYAIATHVLPPDMGHLVNANAKGDIIDHDYTTWRSPSLTSRTHSPGLSSESDNEDAESHPFGCSISVKPTGLNNVNGSCATSALLQVLIRARGFVRSCQGETHWAIMIRDLIGNMRRSDGKALQPTALLQWIRDRFKDQDSAYKDDPQSLLFHFFQHMVHEKGEFGGPPPRLVLEFGIAEQDTQTCTCGRCNTGEEKLIMFLQLTEVKRTLQSSVHGYYGPRWESKQCDSCNKTTRHTLLKAPITPPPHLAVLLQKDQFHILLIQLGECFYLDAGLKFKYQITGTVEHGQNHFVAHVLHDDVTAHFDDETVTTHSGSHAAYVMICNRIPNQEEQEPQVGLQLP